MTKKSVLIVDDDIGTCETLSDVLEACGFDVAAVRTGGDCLEMIKKRQFDVVLLDIKMPGMNGLETFRKITLAHLNYRSELSDLGLTDAQYGLQFLYRGRVESSK